MHESISSELHWRDELTDGLPLHSDDPPLRVEEGGAIRVGKSGISLERIVEHYENGMTPEDMVRAHDTLVLADVYSIIAFYLRNRDAVRVYSERRNAEAECPKVARDE